jgi:hypothetical protein
MGLLAGGCRRHRHPRRDARVVRKPSTIRDRRDGLASRRRPCVECASVRRSHATSSSSRAVECGASGLAWGPPPPSRTAQRLLPRRRPVQHWPGHRPSRGSSVCICGPNRSGRARCAPVVQSSEQSFNECTSSEATPGTIDDRAEYRTGIRVGREFAFGSVLTTATRSTVMVAGDGGNRQRNCLTSLTKNGGEQTSEHV